jgi:hypothetical protein
MMTMRPVLAVRMGPAMEMEMTRKRMRMLQMRMMRM